MKVLIYEPCPGGHRYEYVGNILPALKELGVEVVVASTAGGFESPEFQIHLEPLTHLFSRFECPVAEGRAASLRQFLLAMETTIPDHAYIPMADGMTQIAGLRSCFRRLWSGEVQVEALHFLGGYGYRSNQDWREQVTDKAYRFFTHGSPWTRYWHVDPWQLESLCKNAPKFRQRSVLLPDPVAPTVSIDRTAARHELGLSQPGAIIGCTGRMSDGKGIHLLIDAFSAALPALPADTHLLLFGEFSSQIRQHLSNRSSATKSRTIAIDRLLTDREMEIVVPAMDVVCTPYPRSARSSGIALRAISAGRPLVGPNSYWMGKVIPPLSAGFTCDVEDIQALGRTLVDAVNDCHNFRQSDAAKKYLEFQSIPNFRATWTSLLRQRLGMPEDSARIRWEEVSAVFSQ